MICSKCLQENKTENKVHIEKYRQKKNHFPLPLASVHVWKAWICHTGVA